MSQEPGFRRNIGLFLAVMIGIGAMMGPGIFALPGGPEYVELLEEKGIAAISAPWATAAIIRGEQYVVPRGDSEVQAGDQVIFVGPTSSLESAQSIFRLAT